MTSTSDLRSPRPAWAMAAAIALAVLATMLVPTPAPAQPSVSEAPIELLGLDDAPITHQAFSNEPPVRLGPPIGPAATESAAADDTSRAFFFDEGLHAVESHPILPYTFFTDPLNDTVVVVASRTAGQTGLLTIPDQPTAMAFSPDGELMYFASGSTQQVHEFAIGHYLATGDQLPTRTIPLSVEPWDIVMGDTGILHVLGREGGSFWEILSIDPNTLAASSITANTHSLYISAGELEINKAGTRLYYGSRDLSPASLAEFDMTVTPPTMREPVSEIFGFGPIGSDGNDLELSLDGSTIVYPANTGQNGINRFSTADLTVTGNWATGGDPKAVALSPDLRFVYTASAYGVIDMWQASAPFAPVGSFEVNGQAREIHSPPTGSLVYAILHNGRAAILQSDELRQDVDTCLGVPVTVDMNLGELPTPGMDVIAGTPGADTIRDTGGSINYICAGDGDDTFFGGPGGDIFNGENGDDRAHGYGGGDALIGGEGRDVLIGGPGDDFLSGDGGVDRLLGGPDHDRILGGGGSDRIYGGSGDDIVEAGSGADKVWGGPGDDTLGGMGGQDRIRGDAGNDTIQGSHQSDRIDGGVGDDILRGAAGKDTLNGGGGNDELYGGDNSDTLTGGAGDDLHHGQRGSDSCDRTGATAGDTFQSC